MKISFILSIVCLLSLISYSQTIPDLPIPIGAGTIEVWNNEIYHFGGSNNWGGSIVYPRIYRFNGTSWAYHDSIPDYNLWDVESVRVGDDVYLISGWPSGPEYLRKYNLTTKNWTYLANSPNTTYTWGVSAEFLDGKIYLFLPSGAVYAYTITTDSWYTKTSVNKTGTWDLSSILYNNEIYVIGYNDSTFFKYSPSSDQWTQLSNSLYQVGACAMGIINDLIYCIGGNYLGSHGASYKSVLVYDITSNNWDIDSLEISGKRHWMATAEYKGGLYIVGGLDSLANAVSTIEEIVPQGTAVDINHTNRSRIADNYILNQNYPNPFNPSTIISYVVGANHDSPVHVELAIYNILSQKVAMLVSEKQNAGKHSVEWDGSGFPSGVYFYKIKAGDFVQTKRMLLIK